MIYPNGIVSVSKLREMVYSKEYIVWFEPNDQPADWDWKTQGFYHSPHRTKITTQADLLEAIKKEYDKEGRIAYEITDVYYTNHPYVGEEIKHIEETFIWQYTSNFGRKLSYKVCPCSYLGESPKHIPLEIVCYEDGFNSSCFQICSWERDSEGYEFHSCGSRLFEYVEEEDIPRFWNIIKEIDDFLAKRFKQEND